jgi:hypothetical protein
MNRSVSGYETFSAPEAGTTCSTFPQVEDEEVR